jgi:hypothetical protein
LKRGDILAASESLGTVANFPDNNHIHFQYGGGCKIVCVNGHMI